MDRTPITPISGFFSAFEGVDIRTALFGSANRVLEFFPTVLGAPSTGNVVVELRGPTQSISATILSGNTTPASPATGIIDLNPGDELFQHVVSAQDARDLAGWYTIEGVTGVTPSVQLTTLQIVKEYGGITDAATDSLLTDLISRASDAIIRYIDVEIVERAHSQEKVPGGWERLVPKFWPITDVTEVRNNGDVVDPSTYYLDKDMFIVKKPASDPILGGTYWNAMLGAMEVDYTAGFSTIPTDITHAATLQTLREFQRTAPSGNNNLGIESSQEASGGQVVHQTGFLLPEVRSMLAPYKRP